jgi:hypothetical protein
VPERAFPHDTLVIGDQLGLHGGLQVSTLTLWRVTATQCDPCAASYSRAAGWHAPMVTLKVDCSQA